MTVDCTTCSERLLDMLDASHDDAELSMFFKHLDDCESCASEFIRLQDGAAWAGMLRVEEPDERLDTSFLAAAREAAAELDGPAAMLRALPGGAPAASAPRVAYEPETPVVSLWSRIQKSRLLPQLSIAAALMLMVSVGFLNIQGEPIADELAGPAPLETEPSDTAESTDREESAEDEREEEEDTEHTEASNSYAQEPAGGGLPAEMFASDPLLDQIASPLGGTRSAPRLGRSGSRSSRTSMRSAEAPTRTRDIARGRSERSPPRVREQSPVPEASSAGDRVGRGLGWGTPTEARGRTGGESEGIGYGESEASPAPPASVSAPQPSRSSNQNIQAAEDSIALGAAAAPPSASRGSVQQGIAAYQARDWQRAIAILTGHYSPLAQLYLARSYVALRRWPEAVAAFERAGVQRRGDGTVREYARALAGAGRHAEAQRQRVRAGDQPPEPAAAEAAEAADETE